MNTLLHRLALAAIAFFSLCGLQTRAITLPGADGSDGALNITANTVIDLSQAVSGAWSDNNSANASRGIYDSNKWAVVFKYSSVNIAAGTTVTFKNHASRAPVVWLVNGNVLINGVVDLNGTRFASTPRLTEPGPGGFRGGSAAISGFGNSVGFGPGGGYYGAGGSFGSSGQNSSTTYGNPSNIPLIGGSGSYGGGDSRYAGGSGGGALMIASSGILTLNGELHANGGDGVADGVYSGAGSGGAFRLIADELAGTGLAYALPGGGNSSYGGVGRVRIERVTDSSSISTAPDPSIVKLPSDASAVIWPPSGSPEARIISVADTVSGTSKNTPPDPRAEFGTIGADVVLPQTSQVKVTVETKNVEVNSVVRIRITPRTGANPTEIDSTLAETMSTTPELVLRWTATLPSNVGYSALQARVIRP